MDNREIKLQNVGENQHVMIETITETVTNEDLMRRIQSLESQQSQLVLESLNLKTRYDMLEKTKQELKGFLTHPSGVVVLGGNDEEESSAL